MKPRRAFATAFAAVLTLAGCERDGEAPVAAVTRASASAAVRPAKIRIAQTTVVEVTVLTPPDHHVLRALPGTAAAAFELQGVESLPVEAGPGGSRHRRRYRLRARQLGDFAWSAGAVRVTATDGTTQRLRIEPVRIEVASVLAEFPDRTAPFGARAAPPATQRERGVAMAVGAGALAVAAAWAIRRRVRRRRATAPQAHTRMVAPWTQARTDLLMARDALTSDATWAADATATALRRYMVRRFGAEAGARTTEELAAAKPPFAATSRWPTFVALLQELDALRFPRPERDGRGQAAARIGALLHRAEEFVETSLPPEPLR